MSPFLGPPTPVEHLRDRVLPHVLGEYQRWPSYGWFAAEAHGEFIGWFALRPHDAAPDAPELGYRLRRAAWGHGYATEGSRAVMERVGMRHIRTYLGEFDDPLPGTALGEVVYEITRAEWLGR